MRSGLEALDLMRSPVDVSEARSKAVAVLLLFGGRCGLVSNSSLGSSVEATLLSKDRRGMMGSRRARKHCSVHARQICEAAEKRSAAQQKAPEGSASKKHPQTLSNGRHGLQALEDQISLLRTSTEAGTGRT